MQLLERDKFLESLESRFVDTLSGEGHCVFISGEAGIGKTSLTRAFSRPKSAHYRIFRGSCDALYTPRPLAPLFDILGQIRGDQWIPAVAISDRTALFTGVFQELSQLPKQFIIVFEDIHWADEATLDFIKFLGRRISQLPCLFLLTYREDEIDAAHPLRNVLSHLPPDTFSRMRLPALSMEAVNQLASVRGFDGKQVFGLTGGNPFYVNEVTESYSVGIPKNISDSILSVYTRQSEPTKRIFDILSIIPSGFETKLLATLEPAYMNAAHPALEAQILIAQEGKIKFKHELYRRTIEAALSPAVRVSLHQQVLRFFKGIFEQQKQPERIIHHAKEANDYALVETYAPIAAKEAAMMGAHVEASKLYLAAIEYYQGADNTWLAGLYDAYAYECYLTNNMKEAIIYTERSLKLYRQENNILQMGSCLRFLSRLWWFEGNREFAETYGSEAVDLMEFQPVSGVKAMAYSNMSQLKMLADNSPDCLFWGNKAIAMARELNDNNILAHAMNNVGTAQVKAADTELSGYTLLEQSLSISLENNFQEHAARAYTNLASKSVMLKNYELATRWLSAGIQYSDERDLYSWKDYMLAWKARLKLETGEWNEAYQIAMTQVSDPKQTPTMRIGTLIVAGSIRMRQGKDEALTLLREAKDIAFGTTELQRTIPALSALMEYEWLYDEVLLGEADFEMVFGSIEQYEIDIEKSEFYFWLRKSGRPELAKEANHVGFNVQSVDDARAAAAHWHEKKGAYYEALMLSVAGEDDKRKAIMLLESLGATPVAEKVKKEMREAGIKRIPRGMRKTTETNPAFLTSRELEVLTLLKDGLQNKEIAGKLFLSAKTIDHHISSILYKLEVNSRNKAVQEAMRLHILK